MQRTTNEAKSVFSVVRKVVTNHQQGCNSNPASDMLSSVSGILTLRFDPASQRHFEDMRRRYFPPERNLIPAHLTLFHSLPVTEEVCSTLAATATATDAFSLAVTGLRSLGRGVAYDLAAPQVNSLHKSLSHSFAAHLIPQDRQKFQPHVVIQNKATSEQAKALLATLQSEFHSFAAEAQGLDLWHYRDGPWELAQQFHFRAMHPDARKSSLLV